MKNHFVPLTPKQAYFQGQLDVGRRTLRNLYVERHPEPQRLTSKEIVKELRAKRFKLDATEVVRSLELEDTFGRSVLQYLEIPARDMRIRLIEAWKKHMADLDAQAEDLQRHYMNLYVLEDKGPLWKELYARFYVAVKYIYLPTKALKF